MTLCASRVQQLDTGGRSRKEQDFTFGVLRFHPDREINPGDTRHAHIRDQQIRHFHPRGSQRIERRGEEARRVSVHLEDGHKRECNKGFIVNHKNTWS